jgi:hypothetical protein
MRSTITLQDDLTLSGLLTTTHVINGTAASDAATTMVIGGESRTFTSQATTTISNLAVPVRGERWPRSGTIVTDLTGPDILGPTMTRITLTFNGTSMASLTISTLGGTGFTSCVVDLSNGSERCS